MSLRPIAAASLALCLSVTLLGSWSALADSDAPATASRTVATKSVAKAGKLVWRDEFNGVTGSAPSSARWGFQTGGNGWGNKELQCYTNSRSNSALDGSGHLVIRAVHHKTSFKCADGSKNKWTSAKLTTEGKFSQKYGRLEVRAKLPTGKGTWPAFWGLGINNKQVGWPRSGEIDVMEYIGNRPTESSASISSERRPGQPAPNHRYFQAKYKVASQALTKAFHTYAVDWTPTSMTYSRDGKIFGRVTKAQVTKTAKWPFDQKFFLVLNLAMGGNYGKKVPASLTATQKYTVDYVRVYARP